MGRKRNPYIQLFTRDILSSPRCRALSESAAGVYLFLLCRLNEPPMPGAYRISDWELHPTWKRSKTQQCLATADKYERLPYFAAMLAKNDLPWKQSAILNGLQELYKYRIIVVEGDMLIQPRMFKDNGNTLPDLDNDGDPVNTILDDHASGSMAPDAEEEFKENKSDKKGAKKRTKKGTEKVQKKTRVSHAPATRALSVENMSNIDNSKGNIGGTGGDAPDNSKTEEKAPDSRNGASEGGKKSASDNLPSDRQKRTTKPANGKKDDSDAIPTRKKRQTVADNPPTLEEIQAYFDERAQQGKPFLYVTPEGFMDACEQSGWALKDGKPMIDWRARVRTFESFRKEHGDRPVAQRQGGGQSVTPLATPPKPGDPVPATKSKPHKYKDKW